MQRQKILNNAILATNIRQQKNLDLRQKIQPQCCRITVIRWTNRREFLWGKGYVENIISRHRWHGGGSGRRVDMDLITNRQIRPTNIRLPLRFHISRCCPRRGGNEWQNIYTIYVPAGGLSHHHHYPFGVRVPIVMKILSNPQTMCSSATHPYRTPRSTKIVNHLGN